jgi:hypothetical protein
LYLSSTNCKAMCRMHLKHRTLFIIIVFNRWWLVIIVDPRCPCRIILKLNVTSHLDVKRTT